MAAQDKRGSTLFVGEDPSVSAPLKIHEKPIEDVIAEFQTNAETGLSAAEAAKRLEEDGPNELEKPPRVSLLVLFLIQLNSVIMYLLMAAVVASAAIKATGDDKDKFLSYVDSIAITIIILINATIAAVTENSANDALEALSSLQSPMCTVIRDGEEVSIESKNMVRGDIVKLGTGDVVPADCRCIKANDFRVNEMLLTGEPEDVAKNTKIKPRVPGQPEKLTADNMAFSSCNVKAGTCIGLVVATGMRTRVGSIAALLNEKRDDGAEEKGFAASKSFAALDKDGDGALTYDEVTEGLKMRGIKMSDKQIKDMCAELDANGDGKITIEEFDDFCLTKAPPPAAKAKKEGCLPDTKAGQTPLQANLEALSIKLGYMAIAVCLGVFIVGAAMGTKDPEDPDVPSWLFMIMVAVTLTVAAIPEGLPLCVTIALSSGCANMVKENVLMRKIAAVETLGSASIICTDKTGTLTEGKMTLVAMYAGKVDYTVTGKGFDPTVGKITTTKGDEPANDAGGVRATLGSAVLCSNTTLKLETDPDSGLAKWTPRGNSSEAPLVVAGHKCGIKLEDLEASLTRVYEIPFSSSRKMMVTITKTTGDTSLTHVAASGEHTAHVKGAPNYIMEKCTSYMAADGSIVDFDEAAKAEFTAKVDELSSQALRVLAIATKDLGAKLPYGEEEETDAKFDKIVNGLTLCGLCASIDPERDGVKDSVLQSRQAGVRVVMITGDYLKTAIAIAKNINILNRHTFTEGNGEATDCGALRPHKEGEYLSNPEIDALTKTTSVFARAKPEDKLEIVKSLQRQGFVCAMTGDGVNDAPALNRADIGVAMGLEGTEVAKGASDMILTDDNFCSIVKAIEKGRTIYAGIQKFVSFIMSVHFAEVLQIFLCIVSSIPVMRQPLQILFLILVTDLPPSIALGFEPGEALTMKRAPRPKTQPIVMNWMWRGIVANGLILTVCIFYTYMIALWAYAGAFTSDEITDPTRTSCAIWEKEKMTPTLKIDCGLWTGCNTSAAAGDALYNAACTTDYLNQWSSVIGTSVAETAEANAAAAITGANGAFYTPHGSPDCAICIEESIRRARTATFISLVWAEGVRAYCSRSFENPIWVNMFSNMSMNKAVLLAQVTLIIALYLPGLNHVLGLYVDEIHGWGWFIAFQGAVACGVGCELYKYIAKQFIVEAELAGYEEDEDGNVKGSVKTDEVAITVDK